MAGIDDYSITAASNTTIATIDIAENCFPSTINNAFRQLMADLRRYANDAGGKAVSAGTDTITLTTETVYTAYADGTALAFIAGGTNTGAATLNVDGVGAKAIVKAGGTALAAGDITSGMIVLVYYDASQGSGSWMLANPVLTAYIANSLLTTRGDIIYRDASVPARLAVGAAGTVLIGGTDPSYSANPQVTTIELGHASDTTLSRLAAGTPGVEGKTIPYVLEQDAVAASHDHTGDTNETILATITIPANALGANGGIFLYWIGTANSDASNKTFRVRFGGIAGTIARSIVVTSSANISDFRYFANRNATNSQVVFAGTATAESAASAPAVPAVDTTASTTLVITGQLADGTDTIQVESFFALLMYKA